MTYRIAIANEKGGVAKTTTTISLGAALAETGAQVLLLDLDPQANLTLALGIEPEKIMWSLATVLRDGKDIKGIIQHSSTPNLDLAPSNSEMGMAERFMPIRPQYELTLARQLDRILKDYDFVIMDCPPILGVITLNGLVSANLLLVPTQAEYFSIYALRNLMNLVRRVRSQYNPQLTYRLLITMFQRRNRTHRTLSEQLHNTFSNGVLSSIIEVDTKLREAPIAGVPVLVHSPKTRASLQYRALAQEILEYAKQTTPQPA